MSTPLIALENIRQRYSDRTVLEIDNLEFQSGAIIGLAGPNGSGKSTLLRLLAFLESPAHGTVKFLGIPTQARSAVNRQVTLLVQEPYLLKRTVYANVAYGLRIRGKNDIPAKVNRALEIVGLDPAAFAKRQWFELSGGEVQRVALAARLALKPKLLLMDEPTASLDSKSAGLIHDAALSARDEYGASLVVASHDMAWLEAVTDHIHHLENGRIVRTA
ncbi:energy-coupling factor ABC transporter ATP-binding protein [Pseudodesulfovibrio indicus]|jgi:tungstate transport system ATP-binding protein|uniref:ABC transporter ATP-binding protein n=1 Tax=Pseudodesulfovibrio indicus TaxID=1716143 RepID=A0A126QP49_9BACT|nr:energy-coupling factor ABC transporter ATP-binding protein [Pseudodesulfovibrio indicus]AMK11579.1 ABC transporter ATP-binding protein [Pseudodesulfovibrio indicus]TDT89986.1 tungstate transport system ATP-binding protein [Pseudodesulfovibrio indicus]